METRRIDSTDTSTSHSERLQAAAAAAPAAGAAHAHATHASACFEDVCGGALDLPPPQQVSAVAGTSHSNSKVLLYLKSDTLADTCLVLTPRGGVRPKTVSCGPCGETRRAEDFLPDPLSLGGGCITWIAQESKVYWRLRPRQTWNWQPVHGMRNIRMRCGIRDTNHFDCTLRSLNGLSPSPDCRVICSGVLRVTLFGRRRCPIGMHWGRWIRCLTRSRQQWRAASVSRVLDWGALSQS